MKTPTLCAFLNLCLLLGVPSRALAGQEADSPSPPKAADTASPGQQAGSYRTVSLAKLPKNILEDQKDIFLFPKQLAKGKHWWPTAGILIATAGLVASDPYTAPPFRNTTSFHGFNSAFSGTNTAAIIVAVPSAMYGWGYLRKNSYAKETALLAGQAVADGFLLDIPFKGITGRKQPLDYAGNGPYSDSFFSGSHNPFHSGGFYSLHAMAATSVATVIARRYRNHRWVPYVAYGLAGAISFSRITLSDHFPADVFFGGAMGYVIARFAVLPARD
jgi:membrane-associated phospholipid phosphatase